MRVFVAGGEGFIGRNVSEVLESQGHEVYRSSRSAKGEHIIGVDLLDSEQVGHSIETTKPDVIINCAGVVGGNGNFEDNVSISKNLIEAAAAAGLGLKRFVVCGSAGAYGNVDQENWPVKEDTPLSATNPYPLSKIAEEEMVRSLAAKYDIDAVVARIFNPVGTGMPSKFLITNVLEQVNRIKAGETNEVSVGRADALRDYVDVKDVSRALALLATRDHIHDVYNIGSGIATSTEDLVNHIIDESNIEGEVAITEMSAEPEKSVASQADISRLRGEFEWEPSVSLRQTIKQVVAKGSLNE